MKQFNNSIAATSLSKGQSQADIYLLALIAGIALCGLTFLMNVL